MEAGTLTLCTGATLERAQTYLAGLTVAMTEYAITTKERQAMFLANVGHETGGLKFMREIWGPTLAQKGYEGRQDLGNVQPGDGKRFMGRGMFQTTGRFNYARLRDRLRSKGINCPDFELEPQELELPEWAPLSACDYVDMRGLNKWADQGDFLRYCIGVNGKNKNTGLPNGWDERKNLYDNARGALA